MSGNERDPLVPKLRFPEFREASKWSPKPLGDRGDFLSPLAGKTAQHFGIGTAKYITYMNVFNNTFTDMTNLGTVDVGINEKQNAIEAGDVLFTVSSETPEEVGMSSVIIDAIPNCYVNSFCALFRFTVGTQPNLYFLGYSLRQPSTRHHFAKWAQGSTRFNLSKAAFRNLPLALPSSSEQQKIADCLSSLDELIEAETQKLDTLKTHKKGLMQQLFPREGKTAPRLRFPEFRETEEWERLSLSTQVDLISGLHLAPKEYEDTGEVPYFTGPSDFANELTSVKKWTARRDNAGRAGDILITVKGNGVGELLYLMLDEVAIGWQLMAVRSNKVYGKFVFHFLATQRQLLVALASGNLIPGLSRGDILGLKAFIPKYDEQQKVADCLSSLDDLIIAQSQKIDTLKAHKIGLMQQLFPALDEVPA